MFTQVECRAAFQTAIRAQGWSTCDGELSASCARVLAVLWGVRSAVAASYFILAVKVPLLSSSSRSSLPVFRNDRGKPVKMLSICLRHACRSFCCNRQRAAVTYLPPAATAAAAHRPTACSALPQFWVSQKNKWCEYCKCWLKDTAQSWAVHERGAGHQENVARSEWAGGPSGPRVETRVRLSCPSIGSLLRLLGTTSRDLPSEAVWPGSSKLCSPFPGTPCRLLTGRPPPLCAQSCGRCGMRRTEKNGMQSTWSGR